VAPILTPETLSKSVVSPLILLSKDVVPNIRINAAKALKIVIPLLKDKSVDVRVKFNWEIIVYRCAKKL